MNEAVLNMSNKERSKLNLTYKDLLIIIVSIFGTSFMVGMLLALATGVYGEKAVHNIFQGYYLLLVDAVVVMLVLFLYKPARYFIADIWNVSALKTGKTYIYIVLGFIVMGLTQYVMLGLLGVESAEQQRSQLGVEALKNVVQSVIYILSVAVITPVKEEIMYRGILYRFLEKKYHFLVGLIVSSVVFGLLHGGFPITAMIMGMVLAILYKKTQSILPSMILHIVWNLTVSILTILSL
ncbi:CPBP family intramembrane glutamic endopeptidase [Bacillus cereus group sp. BfR-BA-01380]|uniref:CPBP family intramembrane glutamic endopeptidase n=1 Tax=Bacillus cereus group sp. BfR-BA-01380 TaxID=2920324 RepID=UPI001F59C83C|nr:type II CAAX endopeptidase family protein [Bacillus cereus group sp. BfR-BA-01380]